MRASLIESINDTPLPLLAFLLLHVPVEKWCVLHLNCPEGPYPVNPRHRQNRRYQHRDYRRMAGETLTIKEDQDQCTTKKSTSLVFR